MADAVKPQDKKLAKTGDVTEVQFTPLGATDKIKLSMTMIKEFIAIPTRSGIQPSPRDCLKFLVLCKGKRANPFEGDCFMIGYDTRDGGAAFSIVCGIELFLKRAEGDVNYDGSESGVIVESAEQGIKERIGAVVYDNETLLGGWAKVYRRNRTRPVYKTVKLSTYNTGRSRWEKDPGGMIAKVALSQALRETYPTALGGLYTQEEMQRVTEAGEGMLTVREPIQMPQEIPAQPQQPAELPATTQGKAQEGASLTPTTPNTPLVAAALNVIGDGEAAVTSWAIGTGKIKQGQTWRDLPDSQLETIIKLGKPFMKTVEKYIDGQAELPLSRQPGED